MHVLLVHGLGRSPISLWGLARYLRRQGHGTELFGYVAAVESLEAIRARLRARLQRVTQHHPYALVGHSLGGLLLRECAHGLRPAPAHLVMLGTPNRLPRLARRARKLWPFRLVTGQAGQALAEEEYFRALPAPTFPYTIVAGTAGRRGWRSPFADEINDGFVAVAETRIRNTDPLVQLPVRHTFMMFDPRVRGAVASALGDVTV